MLVTPIRTYDIRHYEQPSLEEVIVDCLPPPPENSILVISSRAVALCEGSFEYKKGAVRVLMPSDPSYTAKRVRGFLKSHYGLKNVGVIVAGNKGVAGTVLAHSGFITQGVEHLAKAAMLAITKGGRATPMAIITDIGTVRP